MLEGIEPRTSLTPPRPVEDGSSLLGPAGEGQVFPREGRGLRKMEGLKDAAPGVPKLS